MFRLSRMTDYAVVVLSSFATAPATPKSAAQISEETHLPPATVSKLLKTLARNGLLESRRGAAGGYSLARTPQEIAVAEIIVAIEGPIALTACSEAEDGNCDLEALCPMHGRWDKVNRRIRQAFEAISLADMLDPFSFDEPAERKREPAASGAG